MSNEHLAKCDPRHLNVEGLKLRAMSCVIDLCNSSSGKDRERAMAALCTLLGIEAKTTAKLLPLRRQRRKSADIVSLSPPA